MNPASLHRSAGLRTGAQPSRRFNGKWVLCAVVFLHLTSACLFGQADATKEPTKAPLRLAIAEFAVSKETESFRPEGRKLVDLLTSQLSADREFELVERAALEKVLKEASLALGGITKPDQAVKLGKLLNADWFVLGSFLNIASTNFVLVKIVDAQTGIIRDLTSQELGTTNLLATAEALAQFVVSSRKSVRALSERLFLAMGAFEDLGLHRRYPDFPEQMRAAMMRHFQGTRVSVVERSQVNPLLNELRLSQGGLTERTAHAPAQPAFVLMDGLYQSFQDEQSKINIVLRIELMGGRMRTVSLKELPGKPLEAKVIEALEGAFRDFKTAALAPTRQDEFRAQLKRGKQLARFTNKLHIGPVTGLPPFDQYRQSRVPVIEDAIRAFEAALLLDPDNVEAKFYLAVCLGDPQIDKREQARDYWREAAASSTNAEMVLLARKAIANSYVQQDDVQALELISALKREARDLEQIVEYNATLTGIFVRGYRENKFPRQALLDFMTDGWRTECRLAQMHAEQGQRIDCYGLFEVRPWNYYPAFRDDPKAMRAYIATVMSDLTVELPRLSPYVVSGYARWINTRPEARSPDVFRQLWSADWKSRYLEMLAQAEKNPATILAPTSFYSGSLWRDLNMFLHQKDYELAERVAALFQKHGRKCLNRMDQDELDLDLGYLSFRREQWKDALTAFERIGNREVPTHNHLDQPPWGTNSIASARVAVEACRQRLAGTNYVSQIASIASPKLLKAWPGKEIIFTVDRGRVWVVDETGLYDYDISAGDSRKHALQVPTTSGDYIGPPVMSIVTARNKVWLGTYDQGVIGVDPNTDVSTNYTVNEGLLTPHITSLFVAEDRLWMGFGGSKGGGVGYLDLSENRFVGMMGELPADLTEAPKRGAFSSSLRAGASVPRGGFVGFARLSNDQLWGALRGAVMSYVAASNRWESLSLGCSGPFSCFAANDKYMVFPCYEPTGWHSGMTEFGGLFVYDIGMRRCRRLAVPDGLPNVDFRSVAVENDKAWVGGKGFIAVVDLPSARVEKLCKLRSVFRVRCLELVGNEVWFSSGPGLYRLAKDAR